MIKALLLTTILMGTIVGPVLSTEYSCDIVDNYRIQTARKQILRLQVEHELFLNKEFERIKSITYVSPDDDDRDKKILLTVNQFNKNFNINIMALLTDLCIHDLLKSEEVTSLYASVKK